ncbi:MAG TPA: cytochrome c oxidase assembly factor 1 family protein [Thermoanaerobaculia bacterium]|nr:cytochrome c oxidase assembly factor 1 family protein [Thermoanaerobaculia bacterium]
MTIDDTSPPPSHPTQPTPPRGWWSRNWKWFIPVGCLGMVALAVALIAVFIGVVFGAMKSSDVYQEAVRRAQNHPELQTALGTPIERGWWMTGEINSRNGSGDADIQFPISGPNGKAHVRAVARKEGGRWSYSSLIAQIDGGATLDLLDQDS